MSNLINCEQGSDEWLEIRKTLITASDFDAIVLKTGKLSKAEKVKKLCYNMASGSFCKGVELKKKSSGMERGNDLEPEAREYYSQATLSIVDEAGIFVMGSIGYSPDGLVGEHGLIEIKCPNRATHTKNLKNNCLPSEYKAQVQGGLAISGRSWCDFVSYHPDFKDHKLKMMLVRVERDEEYIKNLLESLDIFIKERDEIVSSIMKMRGL